MTDADGLGVEGLGVEGLWAAHGGTPVLRGVDLRVARGELLVVLGPSGAGKSTLLRVVAGLHPATAGRIRIAGRDVTQLRSGRRNVSMVFQSYALFPHLSVAANIGFPLAVRGTRRVEAMARTAAVAELVGCADLLDRRPAQLSGGERQRVALARALVREPDVFLLDEPLSNLDLELRVETRAELRALHDRVGATTVHVTHDQTEALVLADRIAVLRAGLIEQVGTPEQVWREPGTTFVARFVGSPAMNLLPGDGPLVPVGRPGAAAPDAGQQIGFRAEAVRLDAGVVGGPGAVGQPGVGVVTRVDVIGEDAYAYVSLSGQQIVARVRVGDRPAVGDPVCPTVRWCDVHLFDRATGQRLAKP